MDHSETISWECKLSSLDCVTRGVSIVPTKVYCGELELGIIHISRHPIMEVVETSAIGSLFKAIALPGLALRCLSHVGSGNVVLFGSSAGKPGLVEGNGRKPVWCQIFARVDKRLQME